jgi:hypothetical protein
MHTTTWVKGERREERGEIWMQAWQTMRCGMCKWFVRGGCNNKDMDAMVSGGGGMMGIEGEQNMGVNV